MIAEGMKWVLNSYLMKAIQSSGAEENWSSLNLKEKTTEVFTRLKRESLIFYGMTWFSGEDGDLTKALKKAVKYTLNEIPPVTEAPMTQAPNQNSTPVPEQNILSKEQTGSNTYGIEDFKTWKVDHEKRLEAVYKRHLARHKNNPERFPCPEIPKHLTSQINSYV